jgi:HEAT repeat protein
MNLEVANLIRRLDAKNWGEVEDVREELVLLGRNIFPVALEIFPELRGYKARNALVYTATKFALVETDAVKLALTALQDKSAAVRYQACMLLAVAGRYDTIAHLENLLEHKSNKTREDAQAAINAIKANNHDLFLDRDGWGRLHLNIVGLVHP